MNYNIISIDRIFPGEGKIYLFDANVWKYILLSPQNPPAYEQAYINFFDAIINLSSNPRCKKKPIIYINGLIFSEVYNAIIRSYWDAYKASTDPNVKLKEYRNTSDFKKNHTSIKSDFIAYQQYLMIETDLRHSPEKILQGTPDFSDYNDHYYFSIAQSMGLSIVTNDSDFRYQGVEIITMNDRLLRLS